MAARSLIARARGRRAYAAVFVATLTSGLAACEATQPRDHAALRAAASRSDALFDVEAMRVARLHREIGARHMVRAYRARRPVDRAAELRAAFTQFDLAEAAYHEALAQAPDRFKPVIEEEIAKVAGYMRQIQRDRPAHRSF